MTSESDRNEKKDPTSKRAPLPPGMVSAEDVVETAIVWLWPGHMALRRGKLTEGDPGVSKTSVLMDLAARISRGDVFPDGEPNVHGPGAVVIASAEDDPEDTLKPRLRAAGAEMSMVFFLRIHSDEQGKKHMLRIPDDIEEIEHRIEVAKKRTGATYAYVVIDPLVAYLTRGTDTYRDNEVRDAMAFLQSVCERTKAHVDAVRHFKKSETEKMIHQGGGGIGFIAHARTASAILLDPDDGESDENKRRRVLVPTKNNLGPLPDSLAFLPVPHQYKNDQGQQISTLRIQWLGKSEVTKASIERAGRTKPPTKLEDAKKFLRIALSVAGPVQAQTVTQRAPDFGISEITLRRARTELGVVSKLIGRGTGDQVGYWALSSEEMDEFERSMIKSTLRVVGGTSVDKPDDQVMSTEPVYQGKQAESDLINDEQTSSGISPTEGVEDDLIIPDLYGEVLDETLAEIDDFADVEDAKVANIVAEGRIDWRLLLERAGIDVPELEGQGE